jgi:hypothetical protein
VDVAEPRYRDCYDRSARRRGGLDDLAVDGVDAVALTAHRPGLRGVDDQHVLEAAVAEHHVVVTEDVSTFGRAATLVPDHIGIVYCHHAQFPRTRPGLERLRKALVVLAADPPAGLGEYPVIWWLADASS